MSEEETKLVQKIVVKLKIPDFYYDQNTNSNLFSFLK